MLSCKYLCFLVILGDPVKWLFSPKESHGLRNTCFLTINHFSSWVQKRTPHHTARARGVGGSLGKTLLKAFGKLPGAFRVHSRWAVFRCWAGRQEMFSPSEVSNARGLWGTHTGRHAISSWQLFAMIFSFFMGTSSALGCYLRFYT